ncbi:MAG: TrkA family potassium uptake protein [Chloroflexi bacterium]|jgi:trk system potassium uptake protein|nr:TrkA family potassium uptake protein [Chloroflexota bacterium]MBT4074731.1 TrkA family potassium uptake protein [Chloroflexota bacterium]MBT4514432.1 TrkA family potassium uptake protein [Chloroflexota bacterium]MBT5319776.1 TrkA family potassium uptake protein [Chloroflexota bacterium]MBT6682076.1 TrkA family potassium uptake protein [Chloroflexota bacterium]
MYIVIIGAGRIGFGLAQSQLASGQEVFLLDNNHERVETLRSTFGSIARLGDGTNVTNLREAGIARAGLFIAATGSDAVNLAACQLAKQVFNVPSTVAVVVDPENASLFEMLGVDDVVSLTDLAMTRLAASVPAHPVVRLMPIAGRNREMVAIKIPAGAEVVNRMLSEIVLPYGSSVILVIGPTGQTEEPRLDTVLGAEDEVIVVTPVEGTQTLWETLTEMP